MVATEGARLVHHGHVAPDVGGGIRQELRRLGRLGEADTLQVVLHLLQPGVARGQLVQRLAVGGPPDEQAHLVQPLKTSAMASTPET